MKKYLIFILIVVSMFFELNAKTETCFRCNGKGIITCIICKGTGLGPIVPEPDGTIYIIPSTCTYCGGSRQISCFSCNGSGLYTVNEYQPQPTPDYPSSRSRSQIKYDIDKAIGLIEDMKRYKANTDLQSLKMSYRRQIAEHQQYLARLRQEYARANH